MKPDKKKGAAKRGKTDPKAVRSESKKALASAGAKAETKPLPAVEGKRLSKGSRAEAAQKPLANENPAAAKSGGSSKGRPLRKAEAPAPAQTKVASSAPAEPKKRVEPKPVPTARKEPIAPREVAPAPKVAAADSSTPAPDAPVKPKKGPARQKPLIVPAVLLEGDAPSAPQASGPGARYTLTAEALLPHVTGQSGELPESYGTKNLFLAARDPHWLFASWDLTAEQQRAYNAQSRNGRLSLRVFAAGEEKAVMPEVEVHPESKSWFLNVPHAERQYHAELGCFDGTGQWVSITTSKSTFTPPDAPAKEVASDFATIPPEVTFQQIVAVVQEFVAQNEPLLEAVIKANAATEAAREEERKQQAAASERSASVPQFESVSGAPNLAPESAPQPRVEPRTGVAHVSPVPAVSKANGIVPSRSFRAELPVRIERRDGWSTEQAKAVARLISVDSYRRVWMGSLEITELIRRRLQEDMASIAAAELARGEESPEVIRGGPLEGAPSSLLLAGKPPRERGFWFKVNAELIIYGATEADATVTIADRKINLRPDGSFSFRFSLPDGRFQLPAVAVSRDGEDGREARLEFSRSTEYLGHVEAHPQDPALRPPTVESVG